MYTVMVDSRYPFSFVNKDSAYRFIDMVRTSGSFISLEEKNLYDSCEDAMKDYRKLREAQEQMASEMNDDSYSHCHFQSYDPEMTPCIIDVELSCGVCKYWK